jgi:hypothetical protein
MVRTPDLPRATSGPYVFEHILVPEDLFGTFLHDDETVHHRNGLRHDNLELWTTATMYEGESRLLRRLGSPGFPISGEKNDLWDSNPCTNPF